MASTTSPSSLWVASYSDKTDEWVRARLEYLEDKERISLAGSLTRRKEIRRLRVEVQDRKKAAVLVQATVAAASAPARSALVPRAYHSPVPS